MKLFSFITTSKAGVSSIGLGLAAIGNALSDGFQVGDIQSLIEGCGFIVAGIGLIFAKDDKKPTL